VPAATITQEATLSIRHLELHVGTGRHAEGLRTVADGQERRFLAILGAARQVELLPTGALLLSTPEGKSLRFFPEQPVKPAVASPIKHGLPLQCGDETLLVTVVGDTAKVAFADGDLVELPAIASADPAAPRTYTNGRMTLVQRLDGHDARFQLRARRMVPTRCRPALVN